MATIAITAIIYTPLATATIPMFVKLQSSPFQCQIISVVLDFNCYPLSTPPVLRPSHSWTHRAFFRTNMEYIPHYIYHCSSSALPSSLFSICKESAKVVCTILSPLLSLLPALLLTPVVAVLRLRNQSQRFGLRTHTQRRPAQEVSCPPLYGQQTVMGVLLRFVPLDLPPLWARHSCPQQFTQLRKMMSRCIPHNMPYDEIIDHKRPTAGHLDTKE